jgi:hypothetical protein
MSREELGKLLAELAGGDSNISGYLVEVEFERLRDIEQAARSVSRSAIYSRVAHKYLVLDRIMAKLRAALGEET